MTIEKKKRRDTSRKLLRGKALAPAEQVRRALAIIDPRPDLREVVTEEIEDVLTHVDNWYGRPIKERNVRAERFGAALRRLQTASRNMQGAFLDTDVAAIEDITQRLLLATDDLLTPTPGRPKRNSNKQKWAAEEALRLLWMWNQQWPLRTIEGQNPLFKLAAVLYGYPQTDLRRYCWTTLRRHRRGSPTPALSPKAEHASPINPLWEAVIARLRPKAKAAKKPGSK